MNKTKYWRCKAIKTNLSLFFIETGGKIKKTDIMREAAIKYHGAFDTNSDGKS